MADETPDLCGGAPPPRVPTLTDLAHLAAELNRLGARYVVVGGFAIIMAGYYAAPRTSICWWKPPSTTKRG